MGCGISHCDATFHVVFFCMIGHSYPLQLFAAVRALLVALFCLLPFCASVYSAQAKAVLLNGPALRIIYTAETRGYVHPCPT